MPEKKISLRIKRELKTKIEGLARMQGLTVSQYLRQHLAELVGLPAKSAAAPKSGGDAK